MASIYLPSLLAQILSRSEGPSRLHELFSLPYLKLPQLS